MLALFMILVSLLMTLFSEKVFISNRCISGLMSNLIKKSWTGSTIELALFWGELGIRFFSMIAMSDKWRICKPTPPQTRIKISLLHEKISIIARTRHGIIYNNESNFFLVSGIGIFLLLVLVIDFHIQNRASSLQPLYKSQSNS